MRTPAELISAYFDGETTPEESAVVERLLADAKRRQTLEDFRHLREELRAMPTPALSSAWNLRLRERLAAAKPAWSEASVAESVAPPAKPYSNDGKIEKPVASGGAAAKSFSTGEQIEPAPLVSAPERLPRGDAVFSASPVIADGRLYATNENGTTFVLQLGEKPTLLATNQLRENTYATPAFVDGRVYVRTAEYLFCIGEK